MKFIFSCLFLFTSLTSQASLEDHAKWLSSQTIKGFSFQMLADEKYDEEEGTLSALFFIGNKKMSNRELEEMAKKAQASNPMSKDFMKKQKASINLMVMDNRVRKRHGEKFLTAQRYLQEGMGGAKQCAIKGATCYLRDMGIAKFVALGVDKNINVILIGATGKVTMKKLLMAAKGLNLSALSTGAKSQSHIKHKKQKVYKVNMKKININEKSMKEGLNKLKGLFGN